MNEYRAAAQRKSLTCADKLETCHTTVLSRIYVKVTFVTI